MNVKVRSQNLFPGGFTYAVDVMILLEYGQLLKDGFAYLGQDSRRIEINDGF